MISLRNLINGAYTSYIRRICHIGNRVVIIPKSRFKNGDSIYIGDDCYIGPRCRIEAWKEYVGEQFEPKIVLAKNVRIHSGCHIGAINHVSIGEDCLIGGNVFITDHAHGNNSIQQASIHPSLRPLYSKGPVVIGPRTWIGENAVVLPGVTIGESCIIGASTVVTKDVPSFSVVVGNPSRIVRCIE